MAGEMPINVYVDWSGPGHFDPAQRPLPCRRCHTPTKARDAQGSPCHQSCAEDELARERAGRGRPTIPDERVATPARSRTRNDDRDDEHPRTAVNR